MKGDAPRTRKARVDCCTAKASGGKRQEKRMLIHHNEQNFYDYENWKYATLTENSCANETRFYEVAFEAEARSGLTTLEVWHYTTKAEAEECYKEINLKSLFLGAPLEFKQNVTIYKRIIFFDLKKDEEQLLKSEEFGRGWQEMDCYLVEKENGKTETLFFETIDGNITKYVYNGVYADEDWPLEDQYELATEDDFLSLSDGVTVTPEEKAALLALYPLSALNIIDHEKFVRKGYKK